MHVRNRLLALVGRSVPPFSRAIIQPCAAVAANSRSYSPSLFHTSNPDNESISGTGNTAESIEIHWVIMNKRCRKCKDNLQFRQFFPGLRHPCRRKKWTKRWSKTVGGSGFDLVHPLHRCSRTTKIDCRADCETSCQGKMKCWLGHNFISCFGDSLGRPCRRASGFRLRPHARIACGGCRPFPRFGGATCPEAPEI